MPFYSARISVLCVTDGGIPKDGYTQDIQVHIFKAENDEAAFEKALEIGKSEELEYKNNSEGLVKWAFKEVEAITCLGESVEDKEVSSRMEGFFPSQALDTSNKFLPENSKPLFNDDTNT